MPVDVNADTIRIRQRDPSQFEENSFRTITLTAGVKAIVGRLHGETTTTIQSYLFDRDKFTEAQARAWVEDHKPGSRKRFAEFALSLPIVKVDGEEQTVEGYASTTDLDSQGDRISLQALSDTLEDYMKFGNIREMHQLSAVGKTKWAEVDEKGLRIKAKIVDPAAWLKVKERVYSAFSIGGYVQDRVGDWILRIDLNEISLVDRPANPSAVIDVWKLGTSRKRGTGMNLKKFGGPDNASDEDVEKLLVEKEGAIEKAVAEKRAQADQVVDLKKQLADLRAASAETIALQAKVEELEKAATDREEKEQNARMKKLLDGAIAAGKFKAAKRPDWEKTFKSAGEAVTQRILADMPAIVPIGERIGSGGDGEETLSERCEKLVRQIMTDEKVAYDVAYSKAYQRNSKLFKKRDAEQLARAQAQGTQFGGDDSDSDE